jgi:hypothetical protein
MVSTHSAHLNTWQSQSFSLTQQYTSLKSHTVTLADVHITHQPHSYLGSPIRYDIMIEFISTLLKPAGDLKPTRNPMDVDACVTFHPHHGWIWTDATGVTMGEFLSNMS